MCAKEGRVHVRYKFKKNYLRGNNKIQIVRCVFFIINVKTKIARGK